MVVYPLHCGRLDTHDAHDWSTPRSAHWPKPDRTYHCSGRVLIEGGWFGSDAQDDKAEDLDREIRHSLRNGWSGIA